MKKIIRFNFLVTIFLVMVFKGYSSGTKLPPGSPSMLSQNKYFSSKDVKIGAEMFTGSALLGGSKNSCNTCHGAKNPNKFKRSSLKRKKEGLFDLINLCITDEERIFGKPKVRGSEDIMRLGSYIIKKYNLPRNGMQYLK